MTSSKFHFVDLAGSERQKLTKTSGQRLKEAGNIHKSLTVLGSVINSLAEGKNSHVRYRDSKLTFFLRDSIGGNSKTMMVANISPTGSAFAETLSTLKFAQRAKQIENKAFINQESTGTSEALRKELQRAKDELVRMRSLVSAYQEQGMLLEDQSHPARSLTSQNESHLLSNPQDSSSRALANLADLTSITRSLLSGNQTQIEIEVLLRETVGVIDNIEKQLQEEIHRKDEFLGMFSHLCEIHKAEDQRNKGTIDMLNRRLVEMEKEIEKGGIGMPERLLEIKSSTIAEERVGSV